MPISLTGRLAGVLALAWGLSWAPSTPPATLGAAQDTAALDGEYGLFVSDTADAILVRWITRRPGPGFLQALAGTRVAHEARTPAASAHRTTFPRPNGELLTLIYGGARDDERDTTVIALDSPRRADARVRRADSVFVVSDVHGRFTTFTRILTRAGVVESTLRWAAGRAHLVVLGDVFDRGPDATRVWWLLYRLEREARMAGGAVHVVLGNHEIMTLVGDTSYLAPKESLLAALHDTCYACLYDVHASVLGRWLASKPAVLAINDAVYAHGGITPAFAELGIQRLNDMAHRYMRDRSFPELLAESLAVRRLGRQEYLRRLAFFYHPESPFWFRGYVQSETLEVQLDSVLRRYGAAVHVIGHTPVPTITARYGGDLITVNVIDFAAELLLLTYSRGGGRKAYRVDSEGRRHEL